MGETLAMSNIAEALITAGFLPEAQQECDNALKKDRYHDNVVTTLAKLKGIPDKENRKEDNLLETVKPLSEFYVKAGRAMSQPDLREISKYWRGPDCVLEVVMHGSEFAALGSYELRNALVGLMAFGPGGKPTTERYQVEYRGTFLSGCVIKARVTRTREGDTPGTLLSSRDDESSVLMIIDNQNEIQVMETTKGARARFYALTRKEGA